MPELGKLLTFMVEEDRQTALTMYSRLFDDAADEQKLMDLLVSPTRQAVVIARTYDARERRQQLESPSGDETTPPFVLAIDRLYQQVAPKVEERVEEPPQHYMESEGSVDQFSLFADEPHPIDESEYVPFQIEAEAVPLEEPVEELPEEPAADAPRHMEPTAPPAESEDAPAEEDAAEEIAEAEPEAEPAPAPEEDAAAPAALPEEAPLPAPMPEIVPEKPARPVKPVSLNAADYDLDFIPETRLKARVFALILYVLLAIPLTLAGIVLLLIPTVLALGLAVGVIVLGSAALVAAFSGFPKLADILIVLGTAVIVLALGLLLLWLFVWFIGGAIGGLIRSVIELGRKWCFVEVPV